MRKEIKLFIDFVQNLNVIKDNLITDDEELAFTIVSNAGYDFTKEEFLFIRKTLQEKDYE